MCFRRPSMSGGTFSIAFIMILIVIATQYLQTQEQAAAKVREENDMALDVKERPFSEIIDGIREQTGKNIIYDEEIKSINVTIRLVNVPWRALLEVIARKYDCLVEDVGIPPQEIIKVSKPPTVTMVFEGADIRDVISHIATLANRNIVVSEEVKGAISLRLTNVPWQDALEAIIKTRGYVLVHEKDDRILRVVLPSEIEAQLETRIFRLRFIRPRSVYVAKMSSPYFTKEQSSLKQSGAATGPVEISQFSLINALSAVVTTGKGKVTYDDSSNTLIITDHKPRIDKMAEIINELDKEPKQVFIDVKFVRTSNSDIFDFGLDIGDNGVQVSQSFGSMVSRLPFTLGRGGIEDELAVASKSQLAEGLPTAAQIADTVKEKTFKFGSLDFSQTIFTLRMLKKDVKSKIVQAPKMITLDHHEATIFVGRTISFAKSTILQNDNGTTSVELKEADNSPAREGFQILVVPHVIPGTNKIQLTVVPSNDQLTGKTSTVVSGFNKFQTLDATIDLPEVTQQVVVTHMILESGQTAVLGGLLSITQTETVRKVPFLGDIPFLGYFFKNKSISKLKEDMYIFITPRIVQSSEDTQERVQAIIDQERKQVVPKYASIWKEELPKENTTPATAKKNP